MSSISMTKPAQERRRRALARFEASLHNLDEKNPRHTRRIEHARHQIDTLQRRVYLNKP